MRRDAARRPTRPRTRPRRCARRWPVQGRAVLRAGPAGLAIARGCQRLDRRALRVRPAARAATVRNAAQAFRQLADPRAAGLLRRRRRACASTCRASPSRPCGTSTPKPQARYLMIEFAPLQLNGQTLRLHWLATFQRDGQFYFFADSKRPGVIAGPYASTRHFIDDYAAYRGRQIVALSELDSIPAPAARAGGEDAARRVSLSAPTRPPDERSIMDTKVKTGHRQAAHRRRPPVGQPDGAGEDRRHAQGRRVPADADRPGQAGPRPGERSGRARPA